MERVQSLINKLASLANSQAPVAELLHTTELLYAELKDNVDVKPIPVHNGISVWLPLGYSQESAAPVIAPEPVLATPAEEKFPARQSSPEQVQPVARPAAQTDEVEDKATMMPPLPQVPVPPVQVKTIEQEQPSAPTARPNEISEKDADLLFNLHKAGADANVNVQEPTQKHGPFDTPATVATTSGIPETKPFPQYPDAATLMKNIFPVAPDPTPVTREVNQLVIDPAIPLNEKLMEKKVELAEVLAAGPKITDLRKAITINDKYQMINVLFRGDENMFERSIRTLNNFGSLPEARFWMQRELVVKLGWDEKEETVQRFQALVSRRFA
jgi:hypothetical protein